MKSLSYSVMPVSTEHFGAPWLSWQAWNHDNKKWIGNSSLTNPDEAITIHFNSPQDAIDYIKSKQPKAYINYYSGSWSVC